MNQPQVKLLMKGELAAQRKRAAGTENLFHCPARRGKLGSPLSHVSWGGVRRLSLDSEAQIYMALTKVKKDEIVAELVDLLSSSKMTVVAKYEGTTVKAMQELRASAEENGTVVKVVKNRLVQKALESTATHKESDTSGLQGMLMYAFNPNDEVAPAQVIHNMAKTEKQIEFIGAYSADGKFVSAEEVKALAQLPSREVMIATVINTLKSPVTNVMSGLSGNLHGLLDAVKAQAA